MAVHPNCPAAPSRAAIAGLGLVAAVLSSCMRLSNPVMSCRKDIADPHEIELIKLNVQVGRQGLGVLL